MADKKNRAGQLGRRRFLQLACVGCTGLTAGCLGGSDGESSPGDDESPEYPTLRETLDWEPSYVMELDVPMGSGTMVVHEGDTYTSWVTPSGYEMEAYRIGTDEYIVVEGQCFIPAGTSTGEFFEPERLVEESGDVRATGRETIDGQDVYRFDVDEGRLSLDTESGYPRRFAHDDDNGSIDFHSWGETDPILPPDMDCEEQ
ncbi:hypothetical protein [Halapricum hydrolyticum]|uniref:Uncharacterized protein n=1 Tax=Halapricum hydrolyticum TaxID=2979991 RepID=A0AAE3IEH9_9EURY|nr:hypothetical protein [Halapricum hydrolyticum]MCU4718784.1 hypothetical protein [Halapricum hydrolyticum]MCU4727808.1 hypothetical protein [Halapricum hydrolyticum]